MQPDNDFNILSRSLLSERLHNEVFDIAVIGGGITGAGIALDAAMRGIKTILVEKQDFASGTSSRSTKLVHGGLRYLEQLELSLVHKIGRERETVYRNAPHIVIPEKMLLPIIKGGNLGEFTTSLALYVYDFLAGVKKEEQRQMYDREQTLALEPLLESDLLEGGALYYEYKTDDSRLVIEVMKRAHEYGASCFNYMQADKLVYDNDGKTNGVQVTDLLNGQQHTIKAKMVINASGPWVDEMRQKDNSLKGKRIHHTKGVHIVVPKSKYPIQQAIYFDVGDRRMVFAVPRSEVVYIGTTDTDYNEALENPEVLPEDVSYLIDAVNRISPAAKLQTTDVISVWAGLRPLIHEDGKAPSQLSRKDEIFESPSGLISIAGGKLTGYRLMAQKVVDLVAKKLEKSLDTKFKSCATRTLRLSGADFTFRPDTQKLLDYADRLYLQIRETGIKHNDFRNLFFRYGTNLNQIIEKAYDYYNKYQKSDEAWIRAEVWYGTQHEMITSLTDFFVRRTGMIHFFVDDIVPRMALAADEMQQILHWSEPQKQQALQHMTDTYNHATRFRKKE